MFKSFHINIKGQVQGVGFRPFVFNMATKYKLDGYVFNAGNGVSIYINATSSSAAIFLKNLLENLPRSAIVTSTEITEVKFIQYQKFHIKISASTAPVNTPLTPDFGICTDCIEELEDVGNRRYNYPFITCVNCGPRYALTVKFPFERENTTISSFEMCKDCKTEYTDPKSRRFHSQTNSCDSCGIRIQVSDRNGVCIDTGKNKEIQFIADQIKSGKIVAIKNTNGYLLCCDATNAKAIQKLRKRKKRPNKPFAILFSGISALKNELNLSMLEEQALLSSERPIVIVPMEKHRGKKHSRKIKLAEIAPKLNQIGVMLPNSGLLHLLTQKLTTPIIATSGNVSGSPIICDPVDAQEKLKTLADVFLHHNLKIENPQDDSVIKFSLKTSQRIIFRRSRGFAPSYLDFNNKTTEKILAVGSHLKSTISYVPNNNLYLSEYLGQLDSYDRFLRFEGIARKYIRFFDKSPTVILADKHKGYQSTIFAQELSEEFKIDIQYIQHHKAHFASVLGEHNLYDEKRKILGVIWDGTGLGDDDNIWGGEFFIYEDRKIKRKTHLAYFNWLSNDKMAKEPRVSLLSLASPELNEVVKEKFSKVEWKILSKKKTSNALKTSSVGRLFDAVASLLGLCDYNSYEGEAAIVLENHIDHYDEAQLKNYLGSEGDFDGSEILNGIYADINLGLPKSQITANFLHSLVCQIINIAEKNGVKIIALSGGVFQNAILRDMLAVQAKTKFELKFNRILSPSDENISYGQLHLYQNKISCV